MFYSATLLAFLLELLKSSVVMQEQMLGGKGFLVIGYLLQKVWENLHRIIQNKLYNLRKPEWFKYGKFYSVILLAVSPKGNRYCAGDSLS